MSLAGLLALAGLELEPQPGPVFPMRGFDFYLAQKFMPERMMPRVTQANIAMVCALILSEMA